MSYQGAGQTPQCLLAMSCPQALPTTFLTRCGEGWQTCRIGDNWSSCQLPIFEGLPVMGKHHTSSEVAS